MYKIEKGIPLPDRSVDFPMDEMEISDSFLVNDMAIPTVRTIVSRKAKKIKDKEFRTAVVQGFVRVWRTK